MKKRRFTPTQQNIGQSSALYSVLLIGCRQFWSKYLRWQFIFNCSLIHIAGALLGIIGTAFSYYNRHDLLSDINREFVVIRNDTQSIADHIQVLFNEQRNFLQTQEARDRNMLEQLASQSVASHIHLAKDSQLNQESWMHWIARTTYVISVYRYFVPKPIWTHPKTVQNK